MRIAARLIAKVKLSRQLMVGASVAEGSSVRAKGEACSPATEMWPMLLLGGPWGWRCLPKHQA